jgi:hypothetical protein
MLHSLFKVQFYDGHEGHVLAADLCPVSFDTFADVSEVLDSGKVISASGRWLLAPEEHGKQDGATTSTSAPPPPPPTTTTAATTTTTASAAPASLVPTRRRAALSDARQTTELEHTQREREFKRAQTLVEQERKLETYEETMETKERKEKR